MHSEQIQMTGLTESFKDHSCLSSLTRKQTLRAEISFLCDSACPHPHPKSGSQPCTWPAPNIHGLARPASLSFLYFEHK